MAFVGPEMDELFRVKLPGCQFLRWNPFSCDIAPRSGGKDVGIQAMLDHFGLEMKDCIAIGGDGGNDVSMIRAAGLGGWRSEEPWKKPSKRRIISLPQLKMTPLSMFFENLV